MSPYRSNIVDDVKDSVYDFWFKTKTIILSPFICIPFLFSLGVALTANCFELQFIRCFKIFAASLCFTFMIAKIGEEA